MYLLPLVTCIGTSSTWPLVQLSQSSCSLSQNAASAALSSSQISELKARGPYNGRGGSRQVTSSHAQRSTVVCTTRSGPDGDVNNVIQVFRANGMAVGSWPPLQCWRPSSIIEHRGALRSISFALLGASSWWISEARGVRLAFIQIRWCTSNLSHLRPIQSVTRMSRNIVFRTHEVKLITSWIT